MKYFSIIFSVRKGKMGGRRKGKDPNHGNSTMVKMRRFMVQVRSIRASLNAIEVAITLFFRQRNKNF